LNIPTTPLNEISGRQPLLGSGRALRVLRFPSNGARIAAPPKSAGDHIQALAAFSSARGGGIVF
jgi:hypothetical protein